MQIIRVAGFLLCLIVIFSAMNIIGAQIFMDALSLLLVLAGALGYAMLRNDGNPFIVKFGDGAIYFGWLGMLIGVIAIAANKAGFFTDMEKLGPALAVSLLPVFYGYVVRLLVYTLKPA